MAFKFQIPVYRPSLGKGEWQNVRQCLQTSWISSKGSFLQKFESRFAKEVGKKHAVAVCNGTTALHAALLSLDLKQGDEVIVPACTYIAPVNAIRYTGAQPVFVDSDPNTWQMDPNLVENAVNKKTRAILAVHLYGHVCRLDALRDIARRKKIYLVEDCAEALGSRYRGEAVGTHAAVATYSFFGNKTITTGEGGMITTDSDRLASVIRSLKGQGLATGREYWHDRVGFNYRMTNICAAIGLAQMDSLPRFLLEKAKLHSFYKKSLQGLPIRFQMQEPHSQSSYWMISILCTRPKDRDGLRAWLSKHGIETRPLFQPPHKMPMYSSPRWRGGFPIAETLALSGLNLPSHPSLTFKERSWVVSCVRSFFDESPVRR